MKKTIVMSGLAILILAAWAKKEDPVLTATKTAATHTEAKKSVTNTLKIKKMENQESNALEVVNNYFAAFKAGASPTELAAYYDEKGIMNIPGDTKNVPWIGKRTGRKEISEHVRLLREYIQPISLEFTDVLTKGNRVVMLGHLESRYKPNNKIMSSDFTIDIVVEHGKIVHYLFLEDSFDISQKVK